MSRIRKTMTYAEVMATRPCYPQEQIARWFAGRKRMGLRELDAIPEKELSIVDRLRTVLLGCCFDGDQKRLLACLFAERALQVASKATGSKPDSRSLAAIRVSLKFAKGQATREELAAAWAAAQASAQASARDAARDAAWDAAPAAAQAAAQASARAAARGAARGAARRWQWRVICDAINGKRVLK